MIQVDDCHHQWLPFTADPVDLSLQGSHSRLASECSREVIRGRFGGQPLDKLLQIEEGSHARDSMAVKCFSDLFCEREWIFRIVEYRLDGGPDAIHCR